MYHKRKIIIIICKRAAYLMINNSFKKSKVLSDQPNNMVAVREFIARCYQIS